MGANPLFVIPFNLYSYRQSIFEDPTLADAMMDRVVHNAHRIEDIVT
jgi:hypothetical protein